jgi:hypothetical protein
MFALKKMITTVALTLAAVGAQAATLTLSAPTVTNGSAVNVNVLVGDIVDLSTFGFTLGFDTSLLFYTGYDEGTFLGTPTTTDYDVVPDGTGLLDIFGLTFAQTGISGSGGLLTLHFNTLGAGTAPLNFSDVVILDSQGRDIATAVTDGAITILPVVVTPPTGDVPEPASLLLLGVGGAAFLARRRGAFAPKLAA